MVKRKPSFSIDLSLFHGNRIPIHPSCIVLLSFQGLRFIPLLVGAEKRLPEEIQQLLKTGRAWVVPQNSSRPSKAAWTDWHPGYKASKSPEISEETKAIPYFPEPLEKSFTFAELFAGIGGFRLGLEAVGGECVFASEIERFTRALYVLNFGESPPVVGDIQEVKDSEIPEAVRRGVRDGSVYVALKMSLIFMSFQCEMC